MIWQKIKNIWKLGDLDIPVEKKAEIEKVLKEEPPRMAKIIRMKSVEQTVKELLEEK